MTSGGYRPNAGRPLGRANNATLARKAAAAEAAAALRERMKDAEKMTPLEIVMAIARELLRQGDLDGAVAAAALAAPYVHERRGVMQPNDGTASPDEIGRDMDPEIRE